MKFINIKMNDFIFDRDESLLIPKKSYMSLKININIYDKITLFVIKQKLNI